MRRESKSEVCFSCLRSSLVTETSLKKTRPGMMLRTRIPGLLVLASLLSPTEATKIYDPQLCYILDFFLGLYGLFITAMFIKEKFLKTKAKATEESIYSDLQGQDTGGYAPLMRGDPERGRNRRADDDTYTDLNKRPEGEYKELPVKRERQRKKEQVYQDLSSATKDTYQSLQMKPLSSR